jgi:hypothetical protein
VSPHWPDWVNGGFELFGGLVNWLNVAAVFRDKKVRGVSSAPAMVFTAWGLWNLFYYPHLSQWWSFAGGLVIVAANMAWVYGAIKYRRN